jgi:circadian clock protein KaiC
VLYFAFEESPEQIMRNMRSIGLDLKQWIEKGLLKFHANRPTFSGIETHLAFMHKEINSFEPQLVIADPISSLLIEGRDSEFKAMIMRLVDTLKLKNITAFFTSLTSNTSQDLKLAISSLIDAWIVLQELELNGERNRGLYILKARGMEHSNQVREFLLSKDGMQLSDIYLGPSGMLTGSALVTQKAKEKAKKLCIEQEIEYQKRKLEGERHTMDAEVTALQAKFQAKEAETIKIIGLEEMKAKQLTMGIEEMAQSRAQEVQWSH